jgi:release factor glutamine methyltransferase
VHSSVCGERTTLERLARHGLEAEVLVRRRGPLGPLLAARAQTLEDRGLLARGEREEEIVVIRAR